MLLFLYSVKEKETSLLAHNLVGWWGREYHVIHRFSICRKPILLMFTY